MSSSFFTCSFLILVTYFTSNVTSLQNQQYGYDLNPNSRLLQSLGLTAPTYTGSSRSTNSYSTSRTLQNTNQPISAPLYLQPASPFLTGPKKVTYLTVGERPRTSRIQGRSQTVLTVSDVGRTRRIKPSPVPIAPQPEIYTNEIDTDISGEIRPYSFEYTANDEESGTRSARSEKSDGRTVTGSYSYFDPDGVYRVVEYTADENGFRANVKTNEPGTGKGSSADPANTNWEVESPPEAVIAKYLRRI